MQGAHTERIARARADRWDYETFRRGGRPMARIVGDGTRIGVGIEISGGDEDYVETLAQHLVAAHNRAIERPNYEHTDLVAHLKAEHNSLPTFAPGQTLAQYHQGLPH